MDIGAFEYQYVPVFIAEKFQNPTNFRLQMSGLLPAQTFTIQASTDLLNWIDVTNFVANESLIYEFVDGIGHAGKGAAWKRINGIKVSVPTIDRF